MKHLFILRHGEAANPTRGQSDRDRSLTSYGVQSMEALGRRLRDLDLLPDLILVSSARRTQMTASAVAGAAYAGTLQIEDNLYNADPHQIIEAIHLSDDRHDALMVVAHNPGIHQTALSLAGQGDPELMARLAHDYRPGTLTIVECPVLNWRDVSWRANRLIDLIVPE